MLAHRSLYNDTKARSKALATDQNERHVFIEYESSPGASSALSLRGRINTREKCGRHGINNSRRRCPDTIRSVRPSEIIRARANGINFTFKRRIIKRAIFH